LWIEQLWLALDGAVQLWKSVASRGKSWGGGSVNLGGMTDVKVKKAWFAWQKKPFEALVA
jgi:uncharacterized membrane protein